MVWQVAIEEGRLKEAGFDATFEWFDDPTATPDVVNCIDGAALVVAGDGARNVMIILADYASDNGMIIGKPGAKTLSELEASPARPPRKSEAMAAVLCLLCDDKTFDQSDVALNTAAGRIKRKAYRQARAAPGQSRNPHCEAIEQVPYEPSAPMSSGRTG